MNVLTTCTHCNSNNWMTVHKPADLKYGHSPRRRIIRCTSCRYNYIVSYWKFLAFKYLAEDIPVDSSFNYMTKFPPLKLFKHVEGNPIHIQCPYCSENNLKFIKKLNNDLDSTCKHCGKPFIFIYKTMFTGNIYPYRNETKPSKKIKSTTKPIPQLTTILRKQVSL